MFGLSVQISLMFLIKFFVQKKKFVWSERQKISKGEKPTKANYYGKVKTEEKKPYTNIAKPHDKKSCLLLTIRT